MAGTAPVPPQVEPVDEDGVVAVSVGTVAWCVALVVVLLTGHHGDPVWICVAGIAGGLLALPYVLRRRAAYRGHRSGSPDPLDAGRA